MTFTLKTAVDNFRKQWDWIADETLQRKRKVAKSEYFVAHGISNIPLMECYLCEFSTGCDVCPVKWGGKLNFCINRNANLDNKGLLAQWKYTKNYKKAARLARKIANLPLKKKYREEYENAID